MINGSPALLMLLDVTLGMDGSYATALKSDFAWLKLHANMSDSFTDPMVDITPWLVAALSPSFKIFIKRASRDYLYLYVNQCRLIRTHHAIANAFKCASCAAVPAFCVQHLVTPPSEGFLCYECGRR